jgi:predicted acyltransferase
MLLGLMAGELLRSGREARDKARWLLLAGLAGLALGLLGSALGIPLVKRIWTPSWALWSTGWCALILGTLYWAVDVRQWRGWSFPLVIVGMNSLAIYAMGMLLRPWTAKTFQTHLGADIFKVLGPANAPFMQATVVGLMFWLACWWLHRRRIFLRL